MGTGTENTLNSTRNFRVLADSTAHTTLQKTILKALPKAPGRRAQAAGAVAHAGGSGVQCEHVVHPRCREHARAVLPGQTAAAGAGPGLVDAGAGLGRRCAAHT